MKIEILWFLNFFRVCIKGIFISNKLSARLLFSIVFKKHENVAMINVQIFFAVDLFGKNLILQEK